MSLGLESDNGADPCRSRMLFVSKMISVVNTYGKKGSIQIRSGPEGLRSLDLTLRKRSHYPCYATSPKFRMFSP